MKAADHTTRVNTAMLAVICAALMATVSIAGVAAEISVAGFAVTRPA